MTKSKASLLLASIAGGILSVGQAGLATAADISVCPACTYTTVAAGMSAAVDGDRVVVGTSGRTEEETYVNTNVQMKEGVTLISEGDDSAAPAEYLDPYGQVFDTFPVLKRTTLTILQGAGEAAVVSFPAVDNAILDGFIIENIDATAPNFTGLVMMRDASPTIQNNIIRDNQGPGTNPGIMVSGPFLIAQPLIQDNIIHRVNGPGIALNANTYPTIKANIIYTTPPSGLAKTAPGIGLRDTASAIITDENEIFKCKGAGIGSEEFGLTDSGNELIIQGNTINYNSQAGIGIYGQADSDTTGVDVTIGGPLAADANTLSSNYATILTRSLSGDPLGTITIENNTFTFNTHGAWLDDLTAVTIKGNTVSGCLIGAAWQLNDISNVVIEGETISNIGRAGIKVISSVTMSLEIAHNTISANVAKAGIYLYNPNITGNVTDNDISGCKLGGLVIATPMTLDIIDNEIYDNTYSGMHTGSGSMGFGQGIFLGNPADLHLTVRGNKVYGNGQDGYGGGIDLRHASGVIENNLVYDNHLAGIRFGDEIDSINHNTVVHNGAVIDDVPFGGGIVYDDFSIGDELDNDPPSGSPSVAIPIRNNILVGNATAGINAGTFASDGTTCGDWVVLRDYNLLSANNSMADSCADLGPACKKRQLAICNENPGEIFEAPLFADAASNNYQLQAGSPAVDSGDPAFPDDAELPPGQGTSTVDMGAYGGPNGMTW